MRERGWGRVVAVSSSAVREPIAAIQLSNAHRPGLIAAFKVLARAVAADGVTLNTVLPGRIATDRLAATSGSLEAAEAAARDDGAGRPARARVEELAAAAVFLCSAPRELHHRHDAARRRRPDRVGLAASGSRLRRRTGR